MARITIHLTDEIESQARNAARRRGISLGRWVAEQIAKNVKSTLPPEVLAAIGSFPDFPAEALRNTRGTETAREPLV